MTNQLGIIIRVNVEKDLRLGRSYHATTRACGRWLCVVGFVFMRSRFDINRQIIFRDKLLIVISFILTGMCTSLFAEKGNSFTATLQSTACC